MLRPVRPIGTESDQEFLKTLYETYRTQMYATASRYVSAQQDREDVVQDAVVRLCGKVEKLKCLSPYALPVYIMFTVKNAAINFQAHQSVVKRHTAPLAAASEDYPSQVPPPEKVLELAESMRDLKRVWHLLSEEDRELLYRKYVLQESNGELAKRYHCQKDSVRMLLFRARQRAIGLMKGGRASDET